MNKLHEKSPCCNASIRLFGERRRQCSLCHKTWRVWKCKRGRKSKRLNVRSLFKYFDGELKNTQLQKKTVSVRLRSLLKKFNQEEPWPEIPQGPLIMVADGLIEYFEGKKYTVYFLLFRSIFSSKAVIFPPFMNAGGETCGGWHKALGQIPKKISQRIKAAVCDGHSGLISFIKRHYWILQRCHFHLLHRIAHCASFGRLNKTGGIGLKVKRLTEVVLYQENSEAIYLALEALKKIFRETKSRNFRTVIAGFLSHNKDFRSYLEYPEYFLPTTSNSAEFLNGLIRNLQYRARGFRTPHSFFEWVIGLCKYQKTVTCRGKNQPN